LLFRNKSRKPGRLAGAAVALVMVELLSALRWPFGG
jgi:hypothetical protein